MPGGMQGGFPYVATNLSVTVPRVGSLGPQQQPPLGTVGSTHVSGCFSNKHVSNKNSRKKTQQKHALNISASRYIQYLFVDFISGAAV